MRFSSVMAVLLAASVCAASHAEAQRSGPGRRAPTPTPAPAPQQAPPASPTPQQAQATTDPGSRDQEARMLFEAGRVAYAAGRFQDALDYFQRAYAMSSRGVLLYNVGSAADKLRQDAVALDAFRRYLEAVPNAENRGEVESRILVLQGVVDAQVRVTPGDTNGANADAHANGETTREGEIDASLGAGGAATPRDDGGSVFGKWWFWTIVGAVVVGGTVVAIAAASSGGGLGPFVNGDDGQVHVTLRMP